MITREALARELCEIYPELGCHAAFEVEDPCWKHQRWYYDLADTFLAIHERDAGHEPEHVRRERTD